MLKDQGGDSGLAGAWPRVRVTSTMLGPALASQQPRAQISCGLSGLCIPGVFITYVMLKNQKVTKKAQ